MKRHKGFNWESVFAATPEHREEMVRDLIARRILSRERDGNVEVILGDVSCNPDLALSFAGQRVYFTSQEIADTYRSYLFRQGGHTIRKLR